MAAPSAQFTAWTVASDDLDLVHASKDGDMTAFEELVKRYDRKLFRIAQSVTRNREDSQDAVQETFLKAFQHLTEFREASQFSTWLIRITLNQSVMKLRKRNTSKELYLDDNVQADGDVLPLEVADWAPDPERLYWARSVDRRSFMRSGLLAGGAATVGAGLLANATSARAQDGRLDAGDVAILRFLAAAELIESDLWTQYAELGGIGDNPPIEVDPKPNYEPLSGRVVKSRWRWPAIYHQQHDG
jgi:RNA polymerase sigma factor (sigma-70 family)